MFSIKGRQSIKNGLRVRTGLQSDTHLNDYTAAAHHLAGFALSVDLAQTNPLTKLLIVINLQESRDGNTFKQPFGCLSSNPVYESQIKFLTILKRTHLAF